VSDRYLLCLTCWQDNRRQTRLHLEYQGPPIEHDCPSCECLPEERWERCPVDTAHWGFIIPDIADEITLYDVSKNAINVLTEAARQLNPLTERPARLECNCVSYPLSPLSDCPRHGAKDADE
jgi:hypothetical protein